MTDTPVSTGAPLPSRIPRTAIAIVVAAVPLHLLLALGTELSPDEAYYLCAARLGVPAGFVDHPPLLPWLLRLTDIASLPLALRVRLWPIAFALATSLAVVELARRLGASHVGCERAALVGTWALLPTVGGFVATPDGPALFALTLALLATSAPLTLRRGALGGLALGVATLAKVVALPLAVALAFASVIASNEDRPLSTASRLAPRLALLAGPALTLPLALPSLRFKLAHAFVSRSQGPWSPGRALQAAGETVSVQLVLWSPVVLVPGARALARLPPPHRTLVAVTTALLLTSALLRAVAPEANWWAPAGLALVVAFAVCCAPTSRAASPGLLVTVVLPSLLAAAHALHPFLPLPPRADPTARLHGWSGEPGGEPREAAGVGSYGPAAERCVQHGDCVAIESYFKSLQPTLHVKD